MSRPGRGDGMGKLPPEVEAFVAKLEPRTRRIVLALRGLVRSVADTASETRAWDSLSYHDAANGGRIRASICQIIVRRGMVRLDFVSGARLEDPVGLLQAEAGRKNKRYVPISSVEAACRPELAVLIARAAQLTR